MNVRTHHITRTFSDRGENTFVQKKEQHRQNRMSYNTSNYGGGGGGGYNNSNNYQSRGGGGMRGRGGGFRGGGRGGGGFGGHTGVCYANQRGECNRGDSCRYSHDADGGGGGGGRGGFGGGGRGGGRGGFGGGRGGFGEHQRQGLNVAASAKELATANAPKNDYAQHFVDSQSRPQNHVRNAHVADRFSEYPKLRELVYLKNARIAARATCPYALNVDLHKFDLTSLGMLFDVVLIDP
jgi:hypothetical protein